MPLTPYEESVFAHARLVAQMHSDCVRRKVGAILVDMDGDIISQGWNSLAGPAKACHNCPRSYSGVEPYAPYDSGPGLCYAVHAEARSLLAVGPERRRFATLYVTDEPCHHCKILIAECGVSCKWPGETAGSVVTRYAPEVPGYYPGLNLSEIRNEQC